MIVDKTYTQDKTMQTVIERAAYYRANPHRFVKDYLGIDLRLFQMILIVMMNFNTNFMYLASRGKKKDKTMNKIFSDKDIEYIKGNYKSMTYGQIASKLNYTEKQIRSKALNLGLTKTRKFNKKYFQRITTPNQAYWLGFIYADGYLVHNKKLSNYELGIELINTDHKLLDDLNVELGGVHKVVFFHKEKNFNGYEYETDTCALRIYSKTIVDDLIKCGVVPNKTYSSIYPKCENFIWDFIRGF